MKRKQVILLLCICQCSLFICSCGLQGHMEKEHVEKESIEFQYALESTEVIENESIAVKTNYYYNSLDSTQAKELYNTIFRALKNREETVELDLTDKDYLKFIYKCIIYDNPELFYLDNYSYVLHKDSLGNMSGITLIPKYSITVSEQKQAEKDIADYRDKVMDLISDDMTDFEKEKFIYDYIAENTEYLIDSEYNQTMYSVVKGKSVCLGYSMAFQYLVEQCGIPCTIVTGTNAEGIGHAWNCIELNDNWYLTDVTNSTGMLADSSDKISYYIFNVSKEQLLRSYNIDNIVKLPECKSIEMDYFYHNGLYFETADFERYKEILREKMNSGEHALVIRCGSADVLNNMYRELIDNRVVYKLIGEEINISYVRSSEMLTLELSWK